MLDTTHWQLGRTGNMQIILKDQVPTVPGYPGVNV